MNFRKVEVPFSSSRTKSFLAFFAIIWVMKNNLPLDSQILIQISIICIRKQHINFMKQTMEEDLVYFLYRLVQL